MKEPRLRTVNKAVAPFELNKFPSKFIDTLAKEIVYMQATKSSMSLEGNEWEQIFAECIGAEWKPSNVGLDDVVLDNCQNANGKNFSITFATMSTGIAFPACFLVCVSDTTILKSSGNPCNRNISRGVNRLSPFTKR